MQYYEQVFPTILVKKHPSGLIHSSEVQRIGENYIMTLYSSPNNVGVIKSSRIMMRKAYSIVKFLQNFDCKNVKSWEK